MQNPTNELSPQEPTEVSQETPTEASSLKQVEESVSDEPVCDLRFSEQCKIVWDGLKKGVKYDGCTAVPDFDFGSDCCGEHDYHYQLTDVSRWEADKRLYKCLRKKGYFVIAAGYWLGVRLIGWNFYRKKQNEIFPLADDSDERSGPN